MDGNDALWDGKQKKIRGEEIEIRKREIFLREKKWEAKKRIARCSPRLKKLL